MILPASRLTTGSSQRALRRLLFLLFTLSGCSALGAGISKGPYLQNPTTGSIVVCWVSDVETTGTVRYGEKTAGEKSVRATPARYHKVTLKGLKPYTRYRYEVDCEGQTSAGTFLTAARSDQPFKFAVYGDTRTNPDAHASVLARMLQYHPDFVIQTGDLVADGNDDSLWDTFFSVAEVLLRDTPYFPALGNHERGGAIYLRYFDVPPEYSFEYGNIHFVALDSNRPEEEYAAQEDWLKKDLAAHQEAVWRIVYFHHTPYTCVTKPGRREIAERLRARLEPILLAGKVQIVLNGHDHDYQHHFAKGIHYVVTGGGGAPLYEVKLDTPFVKAAKMAHHYCEVSVNGPNITVLAREPDGSVIEKFDVSAQ